MAGVTFENVQQDDLAISLARAVVLANAVARQNGVTPANCIISIAQEPAASRTWRVHYGPSEYLNRRGGDFIVLVDEEHESITRILRGQ